MALAEDPGHSGEPTALHQVSARWQRINAELQMRAKAAGRARALELTAAAAFIVERRDVAANLPPKFRTSDRIF